MTLLQNEMVKEYGYLWGTGKEAGTIAMARGLGDGSKQKKGRLRRCKRSFEVWATSNSFTVLLFNAQFLRYKYVHGFYLLYQAVKWLVKKNTMRAPKKKDSPDLLGSCLLARSAIVGYLKRLSHPVPTAAFVVLIPLNCL